jgi:hypothetical protein
LFCHISSDAAYNQGELTFIYVPELKALMPFWFIPRGYLALSIQDRTKETMSSTPRVEEKKMGPVDSRSSHGFYSLRRIAAGVDIGVKISQKALSEVNDYKVRVFGGESERKRTGDYLHTHSVLNGLAVEHENICPQGVFGIDSLSSQMYV